MTRAPLTTCRVMLRALVLLYPLLPIWLHYSLTEDGSCSVPEGASREATGSLQSHCVQHDKRRGLLPVRVQITADPQPHILLQKAVLRPAGPDVPLLISLQLPRMHAWQASLCQVLGTRLPAGPAGPIFTSGRKPPSSTGPSVSFYSQLPQLFHRVWG
jgi:hypothetical protein